MTPGRTQAAAGIARRPYKPVLQLTTLYCIADRVECQPRRHKVEPSALAGGSRVQLPGGGLVRFTLVQADYELGHGGNERYTWRFEPSTSIPSRADTQDIGDDLRGRAPRAAPAAARSGTGGRAKAPRRVEFYILIRGGWCPEARKRGSALRHEGGALRHEGECTEARGGCTEALPVDGAL